MEADHQRRHTHAVRCDDVFNRSNSRIACPEQLHHGSLWSFDGRNGLQWRQQADTSYINLLVHPSAAHLGPNVQEGMRTGEIRSVFPAGTAELVDELVKAKADVNENRCSFLLGMAWRLLNLRYMCGRRTPAARAGHMSFGATPLMFAIAAGQYEGAAALIVARANLDAMNYRKQTALDLALEYGAPRFLLDALENNPTACRRMVTSALTNRYLVNVKL